MAPDSMRTLPHNKDDVIIKVIILAPIVGNIGKHIV